MRIMRSDIKEAYPDISPRVIARAVQDNEARVAYREGDWIRLKDRLDQLSAKPLGE
jgi:hypothetical protein